MGGGGGVPLFKEEVVEYCSVPPTPSFFFSLFWGGGWVGVGVVSVCVNRDAFCIKVFSVFFKNLAFYGLKSK